MLIINKVYFRSSNSLSEYAYKYSAVEQAALHQIGCKDTQIFASDNIF